MRFIGQHHIMRQLKFILPNLFRNKDSGANILLKGPSGFGKTTMAHQICQYLSGKMYRFFLQESETFVFDRRVIFIDEIHKVKNLERFYHLMDEKQHVLIFASNEDGELPEAFVNRCYEFIFDDYDDDELSLISREIVKFPVSDEQILEIVNAGNRNPRVIESLCRRIGIYFTENNINNTLETDFSALISEIFMIKDGLDPLCLRYLESLKTAGGVASLSLIKTMLHVDETALKTNVEPVLIRKGLIRITSKGRSLVE